MTTERICENCANWKPLTVWPLRGNCPVLGVKGTKLYLVSDGLERMTTESIGTWNTFSCNEFKERQQGPFKVRDSLGNPAICAHWIAYGDEDGDVLPYRWRIKNVANDVCIVLNALWLERKDDELC